MKRILSIILVIWTQHAGATDEQLPEPTAPPASDILLLPFTQPLNFEQAIWVTRSANYDNQPQFSRDGQTLYYTSFSDGQTDIWTYDLATKTRGRLTNTPSQSEYSPTPMPAGESLSVVKVEEDGVQRLWKVNTESGESQLLLPHVKPVGYHAWINDQVVALFVLDEPYHKLKLVDLETWAVKTIDEHIGRALLKQPGQESVSYVKLGKEGEESTIQSIDVKNSRMKRLATALDDSEDFSWHPDSILLMAKNSTLYSYSFRGEKKWQKLKDFGEEGVSNITRLAVSPDGRWLAMVVDHKN